MKILCTIKKPWPCSKRKIGDVYELESKHGLTQWVRNYSENGSGTLVDTMSIDTVNDFPKYFKITIIDQI